MNSFRGNFVRTNHNWLRNMNITLKRNRLAESVWALILMKIEEVTGHLLIISVAPPICQLGKIHLISRQSKGRKDQQVPYGGDSFIKWCDRITLVTSSWLSIFIVRVCGHKFQSKLRYQGIWPTLYYRSYFTNGIIITQRYNLRKERNTELRFMDRDVERTHSPAIQEAHLLVTCTKEDKYSTLRLNSNYTHF